MRVCIFFPVKTNHGPHQYLCSPQGPSPVKIKHTCISRATRTASRLARVMLLLMLALTAGAALAQQPQTIEQIRVIGNGPALYSPGRHLRPHLHRARLQLALEYVVFRGPAHRARGFGGRASILNIFVREKPTIREINYKGLNAVSQSDVLDRFKKERSGSPSRASTTRPGSSGPRPCSKTFCRSTATSSPPSRPK